MCPRLGELSVQRRKFFTRHLSSWRGRPSVSGGNLGVSVSVVGRARTPGAEVRPPQAVAGGDMVSAGLGCAVLPGLSPQFTGVHPGAHGSAQPLCSMAAGICRFTKTWLLVCSSALAKTRPPPVVVTARGSWAELSPLCGAVSGSCCGAGCLALCCSGSFPGSLSSSLPRKHKSELYDLQIFPYPGVPPHCPAQ